MSNEYGKKRIIRKCLRLSKEELKIIEKEAKKRNVTLSRLMRDIVMDDLLLGEGIK